MSLKAVRLRLLDKQIASEILIPSLKKKQSKLTYGELAEEVNKKFGVKKDPHRGFPHALGRISTTCYLNGLPMLSAMIVVKDTNRPGKGFIEMYDRCNGTNFKERSDEEKNELLRKLNIELLNMEDLSEYERLFQTDKVSE